MSNSEEHDASGNDNPRPGESITYPEGGTRAWLVVFGAWCAMVPCMGLLNSLAVFHAWIVENELPGSNESQVGWVLSCYGFFLYFCGAQTGPIFDCHPIEYLIVPGVVGIVASTIFTSLSTEYYQFLLSFGFLGGISASMLFNPSIAAIGHWFSKKRGLATGIACSAGGLGGVFFPLVLLYLAPRIGFDWAMRTIGLICLLLGVLSCCLLRKRLPPNKQAGAAIDLKALRNRDYAITTVAVFLVEFAVFIPYTYIVSYAAHAGIASFDAYMLNVFLNVGAVPGRILPGYVSDRFGIFNTMVATTFACTVIVLALWLTAGGNGDSLIAFAVLYGFWSGAIISLTPVCVGAVCATEDYGKRNGTTFFVASFGVLVGVPIGGVILQESGGDYQWLIVFGGLLYATSCSVFGLARMLVCRKGSLL